jgi:hypothetical protein
VTFQEQLTNTINAHGIDPTAGRQVARTVRSFRKRLEVVMSGHIKNTSLIEKVCNRVEDHLIEIAELVTAEFR